MSYNRTVKVLFESRDGVLTISASPQRLYIEVLKEGNDYGLSKFFIIKSRWEAALMPSKLLEEVGFISKEYATELQERHEEFLDDLISYWEE